MVKGSQGTSSLHCIVAEVHSLCCRKVTRISNKSNRRVDLSPTKSARSEVEVRAGRVGLRISIFPEFSWPIFAASADLISSGRLSLNKEKGVSSSVRYHVCRFMTEEVAVATLLCTFLNF